MRLDAFREQMSRYRGHAVQESIDEHDPFLVLDRLHELYARFDADQRQLADTVLSEWILSDDPSLRFDAMALSREFGIAAVVPALERLAERLETSDEPGAKVKQEAALELAAAVSGEGAGSGSPR